MDGRTIPADPTYRRTYRKAAALFRLAMESNGWTRERAPVSRQGRVRGGQGLEVAEEDVLGRRQRVF
jgi:hypothetical protein